MKCLTKAGYRNKEAAIGIVRETISTVTHAIMTYCLTYLLFFEIFVSILGKLRFVVLLKGCVYYYESPQASRAKGEFSLRDYGVQSADDDAKRPNSFKLVPSKPEERTWYFSAGNEQEKEAWMQVW